MATATATTDTTTTPGGPTEPMDEDVAMSAVVAEAAADPERRPLLDIMTTAMKVVEDMQQLSMGSAPLSDTDKAKKKEWDRAFNALVACKHRGDQYVVACRQSMPLLPSLGITQLFVSDVRRSFKNFINPAKSGLFGRGIVPVDLLAGVVNLDADLENLQESMDRYNQRFKNGSSGSSRPSSSASTPTGMCFNQYGMPIMDASGLSLLPHIHAPPFLNREPGMA